MSKNEEETKSFLVELIEAGTGLAVQNKKELTKDISHIFKKAVTGKFLEGLSDIYIKLKEDGRIKADYEQTDQARQQLSYVFSTLDDEAAIDEKRFEAVRNIFLNAAQEKQGVSDRNDQLPLVLIKIAANLSRAEIIILETAHKLNLEIMGKDDKTPKYQNRTNTWIELIAKESGLRSSSLVRINEATLMSKGLISDRTAGDNVVVDTNYRLTDLALILCEFIEDIEQQS